WARPGVAGLKWEGVTLDYARIMEHYGPGPLWFDDVLFRDDMNINTVANRPVQPNISYWVTGSRYEGMKYGLREAVMGRHVEMDGIWGDAVKLTGMSIGVTIDNLDDRVSPGSS